MNTADIENLRIGSVSDEDVMQQYGVLPWRKDRHGVVQVLLITSRRRQRWIVPKGWPVEGRPNYMAAALEAFEEAGVVGEIWPSAFADYHYMKESKDGSLRRCRVTLFSLRVRGTLTNWPERKQRIRRWLPLAEATDMVDDAELAHVLRETDVEAALLAKPEFRFGPQVPKDRSGVPAKPWS